MAGEDDDRHRDAALTQNLLHLESVHVRHPDIQEDAAWLDMANLPQERDTGRISGDRITRRLEHEPGGTPDRLLVIDYVDHPSIRH